jgi:hypothetical protein
MERLWADFLRAPDEAGHAAQIYAELDELAESVAAYLATGFAAGEPAIVIASPDHHETFAAVLAATGWDGASLVRTGLLTNLDAGELLPSLLESRKISARRFEEVMGGVLDRATDRFPGRRVRVFGELVGMLAARGQVDKAAALEALWNQLAKSRRCSLLCGYRLDLFDAAAQRRTLPLLCDVHTYVKPAHDMARLDRAVYDAVDEVLGSSSARMVHGIVSEDTHGCNAPPSQQMLLWISARMPRHAERVLTVARDKYERSTAAR